MTMVGSDRERAVDRATTLDSNDDADDGDGRRVRTTASQRLPRSIERRRRHQTRAPTIDGCQSV